MRRETLLVTIWTVFVLTFICFGRAMRYEPPRFVFLPWSKWPLPPSCYFQQRFDMDCPGCGVTRSVICTLRLRLVEAIHLNPAGPLLCLGLIASVPWHLYLLWSHAAAPIRRATMQIEIGALLSLFALLLVRWVCIMLA